MAHRPAHSRQLRRHVLEEASRRDVVIARNDPSCDVVLTTSADDVLGAASGLQRPPADLETARWRSERRREL